MEVMDKFRSHTLFKTCKGQYLGRIIYHMVPMLVNIKIKQYHKWSEQNHITNIKELKPTFPIL